jgi:hypothetical protein
MLSEIARRIRRPACNRTGMPLLRMFAIEARDFAGDFAIGGALF